MAIAFKPIVPRPAPIKTEGLVPWIRTNLFGDWKSIVTTVIVLLLAAIFLPRLADWALIQAVFQPNADACQAARGAGACWGVVSEKYRIIIFGRYPYEEQWRPLLATVLLLGRD